MEELISRLKKEDKKAQKELYDKYSGLFYVICLRYSANSDEAKDFLQEGFIKIFLNIKQYNAKGSFEGWMKRIIINNAINNYHKELKRRYAVDIDEVYNLESDNYKIDESDFSYEELLQFVQKLPKGYRTIFNLFAIEGYKHKEIAEMLDISESTSKSQYHRAKKILQTWLTKIKEERNAR